MQQIVLLTITEHFSLSHYHRVFTPAEFPLANYTFHCLKSNTTYLNNATGQISALARGSLQ